MCFLELRVGQTLSSVQIRVTVSGSGGGGALKRSQGQVGAASSLPVCGLEAEVTNCTSK